MTGPACPPIKGPNLMTSSTLRRAALAGLMLTGAHGPARADKASDTFVWATSGEIGSTDPYYAPQAEAIWSSLATCDMLVWKDPRTRENKPLLAEKWSWANPTSLDVTLRKGVRFHNGHPFGPEDVAYTLNQVSRADSGMGLRVVVDWIDHVEVTGPDSVRIHAKSPTPMAIDLLSGMVPIYEHGNYDRAPTVASVDGRTRRDFGAVVPSCTGPYKLTQYKPGQGLTLVKNPDYFRDSPKGQPTVGKIVFRVIPDTDIQLAELLTGGIDWMWGVPAENAKQLAAMPDVSVQTGGSVRFSFLTFDTAQRSGENPLKDIRVRQAFAYAIDRNAIAANFIGAGAKAVVAMCTPIQTACAQDVATTPYDPSKARALLAEAGYPNGLTLPYYVYRDKPYAEAVVAYLDKAGIHADMRFMQYPAFAPLSAQGKLAIRQMSWGSSGILDASAAVGSFYKGGVEDYSRDEQVITWLSQADATVDAAARTALYRLALNRINEQALGLPLYSYGRIYAMSKDFEYPISEDDNNHFYLGRWR